MSDAIKLPELPEASATVWFHRGLANFDQHKLSPEVSHDLFTSDQMRDYATRAAASALEGAERRWVPVSERLPEPEVDVLCYGPNRIDPTLPWLMFVDWFGGKPDCGRGVTHWMPLPGGPKHG